MTPKAALRLLALAALTLPLIPVQWLALHLRWRLAATLPAAYHRWGLALLGVRLRARGTIEARRPLLLVANHVSWLDIPVLSSLAPLSFVAKREVAGWPGVGLLARLQRTVFVDRTRRGSTGEAAAGIGRRLGAGDAMVLFAEGTTGDGLHVLPFRSALLGSAGGALGGGVETAWVQPLALAYVRRGGLPVTRARRPALAWMGDVTLAPHALGILSGGPVEVAIQAGEARPFHAGTDRKALAASLERDVRDLARQARTAGF